jgi:CRISPR-associated endonuclease Cas2
MIVKLISYDISSDKLRSKLAHKLESFGMTRLQYSIWIGSHTQAKWDVCWTKILKLVARYELAPSDKIYQLTVSRNAISKMMWVGCPPDLNNSLTDKIAEWF